MKYRFFHRLVPILGLILIAGSGSPIVSATAQPLPSAPCAESNPTGVGVDRMSSRASPTVCCVKKTEYSLTASNTYVPFQGVSTATNGPGPVTSTFTRSINATASVKVVAGVEAEAGVVLAKAKTSLGLELLTSNSTTTTNSVTLKAPKGQYAHGQYVAWGKQIKYRKYRVNANCSTTTLRTGTIKYPQANEGWRTWVDSSSSV